MLALAAPASAADVHVDGGVLRLEGASIDADATQDGDSFSIYDYMGTLDPGDGCELDVPEAPLLGSLFDRTITCTGVTTAVEVRLEAEGEGEGNFVYVHASLPKRLHGGPGSDILIGSGPGVTEATGGAGRDDLSGGDAADVLDGGEGGDGLRGGGGVDRLIGGPGDDHLTGDAGGSCCFEDREIEAAPAAGTPDVLDGGEGSDSFDNVEPADVVSGAAGRDTVTVLSKSPVSLVLGDGGIDVENLVVSGGDATVRADARPNEITTYGGNDTIDPGGGFDEVGTGAGDDTVNARDGSPDYVRCDDGTDRVVADADDDVDSSCETVERAAAPAPAAPAAAAPVAPTGLKVSARRKSRRVTVRGRVMLPAGTPASLCRGGGVMLQIRGARPRTLRRGTVLNDRCRFTVRLRGSGKRRLRVKASFAGTPSLAPIAR